MGHGKLYMKARYVDMLVYDRSRYTYSCITLQQKYALSCHMTSNIKYMFCKLDFKHF